MRRFLFRSALVITALLAVLVGGVFLALQVHSVQVEIGERAIAALGGEVEGTITIGEYVTVSLSEIHVREFRVVDSDGSLVLELDEVIMIPDLPALLERRISVVSAHAEGGTLRIAQEEGGFLHLDHAFRSTHVAPPLAPGEVAPPPGGDGFTVDLRNIDFRDLGVDLAVPGAPGAHFQVERGSISVSTNERGVPSVRFHTGAGLGRLSRPEISIGVASATGVFDGSAVDRAVVSVDSRMNGSPVPMELLLRDPGDGQLDMFLRIDPSRGGIVGRMGVIAITALGMGDTSLHIDAAAVLFSPTKT